MIHQRTAGSLSTAWGCLPADVRHPGCRFQSCQGPLLPSTDLLPLSPSFGLVQVFPEATIAVMRVCCIPIHHPAADALPAAPAHLRGMGGWVGGRECRRVGNRGGQQQMQVAELSADEQAHTPCAYC